MKLSDEHGHWKQDIESYQKPSLKKSWWQILNTILPFAILWYSAYWSLSISVWLTFLLTIPASAFMIRIFIIFHDCGHHSFFKSRKANDAFGILTGLLTFFPYYQWRYEHSVHHAGNGDLNRRGMGDIVTLTVDEYLALGFVRRTMYRLYRNPLVMFGLGPIFVVLIQYRFNRKGAGKRERWNTHLTSLALLAIVGLGGWALGFEKFALVEGPILYFAGVAGIWLFYVQHQFAESYFEKTEHWDYVSAALHGSSFYKLPKIIQWITGNIGFHHIHHLGPRVPNYNLQKVFNEVSYLQQVPTLGLLSSLRSLRYRVWDEDGKRFIGFKGASLKSKVRIQ